MGRRRLIDRCGLLHAWCRGGCIGPIGFRMLEMFLPIGGVLLGERRIANGKEIFRVFLLGRLVKLKLPVRIVLPSMIRILLWAMACWASIQTGMPAWSRNVATE
jgi:hypothetical protein